MILITVHSSSEMNQCDCVTLIFNVTQRYKYSVIGPVAEPMRSSPCPDYNGLCRVCYLFSSLPKSGNSHGEHAVHDWDEVHYGIVDRIGIKVRVHVQRRHI